MSVDDANLISQLATTARASLSAVVDMNSLKNAFDTVNAIIRAIPVIGYVAANSLGDYLYLWGGPTAISATGPLPQERIDLADSFSANRAYRALLRKIANAALKRYRQVTSNLPGTANGVEACAKMVQLVLLDVYSQILSLPIRVRRLQAMTFEFLISYWVSRKPDGSRQPRQLAFCRALSPCRTAVKMAGLPVRPAPLIRM